MKPTMNLKDRGNSPAVLFRPTFHVTGEMLRVAIVDMIRSTPKVKITIPTVQDHMTSLLVDWGNSIFKADRISFKDIPEEITTMATAHAHVLFPEFFGETPETAQATYGEILKPQKPAKDLPPTDNTEKGQEAGNGPENAGKGLSDETKENIDKAAKTRIPRKKKD